MPMIFSRCFIAAAMCFLLAPDAAVAAASVPSRITLLGTTGGPQIRSGRSQPSTLLVAGGKRILIDCGSGTVEQLAKIGLHAADIDMVFLTHLHFDHIAGLAPLIGFRWVEARSRLPIYGPPGTRELVAAATAANAESIDLYEAVMRPKIDWETLATGYSKDLTNRTTIYEEPGLRVVAVENTHYVTDHIPPQPYGTARSYSYRFEMPDRTIVFTGDTGPSPALTDLATGADLLISEITDPIAGLAAARRRNLPESMIQSIINHEKIEHMSPEAVGRLAADAGVKMVVLSHLGYSDAPRGNEPKYVEPIARIFKGKIVEGADLDQF